MLPPEDQKEYEAVYSAIKATMKMTSGAERLRLIEIVFFKKTHTLHGAAMACNVSYGTAKNWHNQFIKLTAKKMELF